MALYSEKVMDHFRNPRNVGVIEDADGIGEVGNAKCGDIMKMYLKIEDDVIRDVKFETFGCGSAIASSSMATELIKGKPVSEAMQAVKTDSLGTEHKFHTEGGRYYNQKSTGHISTPSGRYAEVEINTTQYVPKTTVYDGLYEKKRTTTDNKCAVCGNYISDTFISSTKIGG